MPRSFPTPAAGCIHHREPVRVNGHFGNTHSDGERTYLTDLGSDDWP
ncbi:hypothetical protein ACFPN7_29910 [Amycolatopsis halotolerans]